MKNPTVRKHPEKFVPFIYPVEEVAFLSRSTKKRNKTFTNVLFSRRSAMGRFAELKSSHLSELLHLSTKIDSMEIDPSGFLHTKRTAPSAGARHPIDLIISPPDSINTRKLYYYNPLDHTLGKLSISAKRQIAFFNEISQNISITSGYLIWFSIQTTKTSAKYLHPESLYWRDCGALMYCIQLVATYLGLKSCPIGTLSQNSFHGLFASNDLVSGGGLLLGK